MQPKHSLINSFVKLCSLIYFSSFKINDNDHLLSQNITQQLVTINIDFLDFLDNLNVNSVSCLRGGLDNLVGVISIAKDLKKIKMESATWLERELLIFEKAVIDYYHKNLVVDRISRKIIKGVKSSVTSGGTKEEIVDFISEKGRVLNWDLFDNFKQLNKRSIKRHLSQLIETGQILREVDGKSVYYKESEGDRVTG